MSMSTTSVGLLLVLLFTQFSGVVSIELRGRNQLASLANDVAAPIPVWVWWEYSDKPQYNNTAPPVVQACYNSWKKHAPAPQFDLRLINATNIHKWLPGLPVEFDRMPYVAATSDLVRSALLAEYGGVYLDTDVILLRNLSTMTDHLRTADFVSYTNSEQHCENDTRFSSNVIAANKGNALSVTWRDRAWKQLESNCNLYQKDDDKKEQGVCCYTPTGLKRERCHINWGGVGEMIAHPVFSELIRNKNTTRFHMFCFEEQKNEGFSPTGSDDYVKLFGTKDAPCHADGDDLLCEGKERRRNLFNRIAVHLFQSNWNPVDHQKDIFHGNYVVSELIRRSMRP